ncbi:MULTISPECIES: SDR family oxidoreductase [unclassified Vibrio]|uniref:SDR family oxidoreductase n=1 Tax=Vibrio TaxID=662 RepID=UPI0020A5D117|nr:SDR family oxidoreductase [Vibrio sp. Y53_MX_L15]
MSKIILVLGGAGFIGQHLIRHIEQTTTHNIISIGRGTIESTSDRVMHHSSDINYNTLLKIKETINSDLLAIINCAGSGSVRFSHENPKEDFVKTTEATIDSLEFIRQFFWGARFIQISSAAVYGQCHSLPLTIHSLTKPVSSYGFSNLISEHLVKQYSEVYGIKSATLRVFSVYGNGLKKQILWDACQKIVSGNAKFFGTGNEIRDFIHINDLVKIITICISKASVSNPVYNCGTANPVKIRDLVSIISSQLSNNIPVVFTGEDNPGNPKGYLTCGSEKFNIDYTDLEKGIKSYCDWFLNNGKYD